MTKHPPLPNVEIIDIRHLAVKQKSDPIAAVLMKVGWAEYRGVRFYKDGTVRFPTWREYAGGTIPVVKFPDHIHRMIEQNLQKAWVFFEKTRHSAFAR